MEQVQVGRSRDGSVHVTDERVNTIISLVGSILAVLLGGILLARVFGAANTSLAQRVAVCVYILGFANLFAMSTIHHALDLSVRTNKVLRTLDYTAIFWHTAAAVAVFVLYLFPDTFGYAVAAGTWAIAAIGISLRASMPHLPKHITNTLFISLGWFPAVSLILHGGALGAVDFALLAVGGLLYSAGFVVYVVERPNPIKGLVGFHEIWHVFVLLASISHWLLVYKIVGGR
jgi:hemolysin III